MPGLVCLAARRPEFALFNRNAHNTSVDAHDPADDYQFHGDVAVQLRGPFHIELEMRSYRQG